jgi:hypothetical protein
MNLFEVLGAELLNEFTLRGIKNLNVYDYVIS